ncbi:MAG: hypothetical protein H6Q04_3450 [Acidobacteria bacterium]|nr:hypothetical protein [Acidobacteriota bacterium]
MCVQSREIKAMIRTDDLQRSEDMDSFTPLRRERNGLKTLAEHGFTGNERFC